MAKAILHMNIDKKLKEELQRQASAANRSLSNHVETLLLVAAGPRPSDRHN